MIAQKALNILYFANCTQLLKGCNYKPYFSLKQLKYSSYFQQYNDVIDVAEKIVLYIRIPFSLSIFSLPSDDDSFEKN